MQVEGAVLVTPALFGDTRGFFMETFKESEFDIVGGQIHSAPGKPLEIEQGSPERPPLPDGSTRPRQTREGAAWEHIRRSPRHECGSLEDEVCRFALGGHALWS